MANQALQTIKKKPLLTLLVLGLVILLYYLLFFLPVLDFSRSIYALPSVVVTLIALSPILGRLSVELWHQIGRAHV